MPKFIAIKDDRKDLFVTGSVNRDHEKLREFYHKNVDTFIKAYDVTKKMLKLKSELKFFIRNIRGNTIGFYANGRKEVAIDIRSRNIKSIVSTIIHECQHAFQYETGMLKLDANKKGLYFIWKEWKETKHEKDENGNVVVSESQKVETSIRKYKPSQNREKYMNLPWEIDARNAEKKYIDRVMKEVQ
jgi:hypothetical protein|tara:strand:+ start:165 stop:725 length:561 start_codon:yes stop_codon:yes gene_type:complete